jgi:hypothetical protein
MHQVAARSDLLTSHGRWPAWKRVEDRQGNGLVHAMLPIESLDVPRTRLWRRDDNPMTGRAAMQPRGLQ